MSSNGGVMPPWVKGLKSGLYWDGLVDDTESTLELHRKTYHITYSTRTSTAPTSTSTSECSGSDGGENKENIGKV